MGDFTYLTDSAGNRTRRTASGKILNINSTEPVAVSALVEDYLYVPNTNKLDKVTVNRSLVDGTVETFDKQYSYDSNGNTASVVTFDSTSSTSRTFVYDNRNRLVQVKDDAVVIADYTYNGLDQRVSKTAGGLTTLYIYDFDGNLIAEYLYDDVAGTATLQTEYIYSGGQVVARVDNGTDFYYYHADRLGTPQMISRVEGGQHVTVWSATYTPFGEARVNVNADIVNNIRFPGQYYDAETGLHYNYHRYYDPQTGRYLTPDPIGLAGGINVYAYAAGNPVNFTDRWGLALYNVYYSTKAWGVLFATFKYRIEGLVIALEDPDCDGLYEGIDFEGRMAGLGLGLPVGVTVNNNEIFDDSIPGPPDVRRVEGTAGVLSGTSTFNGWSGGIYRFGALVGTDESVSVPSGVDFGVDLVAGRTWTVGGIKYYSTPFLK